MPPNERRFKEAVKAAAYLLEKLNTWSTEDIADAVTQYECGSPFDRDIAEFLTLYLTARRIGVATTQ